MPEQFPNETNSEPVNPAEVERESIPTLEEVHGVIRQMATGEFQETKKLLDEQGNLARLDTLAQGREEGETMELYYMKKGRYPNGDSAGETKVHCVYLKNGEYNGEGPQATWVNNKWRFV